MGGRGYAIRALNQGRWQQHVARTFEAAARAQVERMVRSGDLPPSTIVGRWWRDETAEIDVLALDGDVPVLVGACKWRERPLDERVLAELRSKTARLAPPGDSTAPSDSPPAGEPAPAGYISPWLGLWSRGGVMDEVGRHPDVRAFGPADLLR